MCIGDRIRVTGCDKSLGMRDKLLGLGLAVVAFWPFQEWLIHDWLEHLKLCAVAKEVREFEGLRDLFEEYFTAPPAPRLPRRGDQHTAPGPAARRAGQRCPRSRRRAGSCAGRVAGASWPVPCASARVPSPCKWPPALLLYGSPHESLPYVLEIDIVVPGWCSCLFRQVHEMPVT